VSGLLNADSVTNVTLTSAGSPTNAPVGGYDIIPNLAEGTGLTNYAIGYVAGVLTVANADLEFRITSVVFTNDVATVTWNSVSNLSYVLQYNDDLAGANWTDVPPAIVASGTNAWTTNLLNGASQRFFRVRLGTLALVVPAPVIQSLNLANGSANIVWSSVPDATYRLQYKVNLLDPIWTDVVPDVTASGATTSMTNLVGGDPQRFYRVMVP
jgi:hypothetical protein